MASPLLWQNEDQTVTLIDIPRSIAAAQGTFENPCYDFLISTKPQEQPFPSQEPKTEKAKANLKSNTVEEELHAEYREILESALAEIRENPDRQWCLLRRVMNDSEATDRAKKRKLNDSIVNDEAGTNGSDAKHPSVLQDRHIALPASLHLEAESGDSRCCTTCHSGDEHFITNCSSTRFDRTSSPEQQSVSSEPGRIRMPPCSSFYIGETSATSRAFHSAIRNQADSHDTRRHFDFILLDPPWPNRSVKRSTYASAGTGYSTAGNLQAIEQLLLETDLDMLMTDDCLVGIWVTNKQSLRDLTLGENGIFAQWGIELAEEWIWLKTTVRGEPVSSIESLWRKPYEVLLLGRKRRNATNRSVLDTVPKRRVIVAVPDFHSRKPCLKDLIEPLIANGDDYRALEVFARHLVAGWWSWGNECAKFNNQSHWSKANGSKDAIGP